MVLMTYMAFTGDTALSVSEKESTRLKPAQNSISRSELLDSSFGQHQLDGIFLEVMKLPVRKAFSLLVGSLSG